VKRRAVAAEQIAVIVKTKYYSGKLPRRKAASKFPKT